MNEFEKLGAFYLGKRFDIEAKEISDQLVMYDSKDLTTHAVCVGMTGSGKTGLCISLLEEAAIDNIPALIIDPKGDMTNLLLTFPEFRAEDFRPWINESEASTKGLTPDEYASKQAELWKGGLEKWHQSGERVKKFKESADFTVYTPGSTSGVPVSILNSFSAPPEEIIEDPDLFNETISSTTTGILSLIGIDADPLRSREHILLSNILKYSWESGEGLDLISLIQSIQAPPFTKIGAFDVETFYPSKERFELALSLNNLMSAPAFQSWFEGEPLDINDFLYSEEGKPRVSILYIAHLNDNERMFFVTLFLNQIISWMRKQSGTGSLRALLYFDEIFGYLPPVSNPPSKKPMMLLLKQARAFGLGLVLATQNPVDLDYKALSNIGTWFIGRLQTERDRLRVLDGLESAAGESGGGFNRRTIDDIITGLDKRVFLLHNVHEDHPEIFHTRWVLSYLAGPLTRVQVKKLMSDKIADGDITDSAVKGDKILTPSAEFQKPNVPPGIVQYYLGVRGSNPGTAGLLYKPYLVGSADIRFFNSRMKVDTGETVLNAFPLSDAPVAVDWDNGIELDLSPEDLMRDAEDNALYTELPAEAFNPKNYSSWEKDFADYIYRNEYLRLLKSPTYKLTSLPDETEKEFRIRVSQAAREERDEWTEKLRERYQRKVSSIESKIRTAAERIEREESQASQQKLQTAINIGSTLLGALFGRKAVSTSTVGKAGTSVKSAGRIFKETQDVERAKENLEYLNDQLKDLEEELENEINELSEKYDAMNEDFEETRIRPRKTDINVNLVELTWIPYWKNEDGTLTPAWV